MSEDTLRVALVPEPQQLAVLPGHLAVRGTSLEVLLPAGPEHEACREAVTSALEAAGAELRPGQAGRPGLRGPDSFVVGEAPELPGLPTARCADQAYVLAVSPTGVAAWGASPAGLLYAAQTLRQLLRRSADDGRLPCVSIADYPEFALRGIYIEGGQERFGRIVTKDYLCEQTRRLAEFKMNTLVVECYNLLPYPSFPECADEGTLSPEECRAIIAEAKRNHVTIIPSLQTLAQASELVWGCEAGVPYREPTAPGLMCPSTPAIYPFIKGLYRDLLTLFGDSPLIGVGCSEIDMQWQARYCPRCQARVDAGETVRELLLGHATQCLEAVHELSAELGRPVRPMMWGDEFYMYGPDKDWVGLERIPTDTVMGFWKYWPDYGGIGGLMERGYDVFGISAMYNHCLYLADLSPADPPKSWPSMEQTGTLNITELAGAADEAARTHPQRQFLGVATASFSKHRLRAFDSIWYGFALNGHCTWSRPERLIAGYQDAFTAAFARHYYDARTDNAAEAVAAAYRRLDACKSQLERANQVIHDMVGVYDTQEAGYLGNSLIGAYHHCRALLDADGTPNEPLAGLRERAAAVEAEAAAVRDLIEEQRTHVGRVRELGDLWLAAEKIAAHAEREVLLVDTAEALARAGNAATAGHPERNEGSPPSVGGAGGSPAHANQAGCFAALSMTEARWAAHRQRVERILERTAHLYSRGDPCGLLSLLQDIEAIERHLQRLAASGPEAEAGGEVLLEERFAALDAARWIVLGEPQVVNGSLETRAPGGWEHYCGIATREPVELSEAPLVVEFDLTPVEMGVDSQLFGAAAEDGRISFRFAVAGPVNHLALHTQCGTAPPGRWVDGSPGWRLRAQSQEIKLGATYRLRAEITRQSFRAIVREPGQSAWDLPVWDSRAVPMDELAQTRLVFADVEPEGRTAASRWGAITMRRLPGPPPS